MKKIIAIIMAIFMLIPVCAEKIEDREEKSSSDIQIENPKYRVECFDVAPKRSYSGIRGFGTNRSALLLYCPNDVVDYVCSGSNVDYICAKAYSNCKNLRTVMICSPNTLLSCHSDSFSFNCKCKTDMEAAYDNLTVAVNETKEEVIDRKYRNCVFVDSPKLTIIGYGGTQAEEYAKDHGIPFIPAFIRNGEPSTIVAEAVQNATVTINGEQIPAYTVNGSVYVGESALKCMGVGMSWKSEWRYVDIEPYIETGVVDRPIKSFKWSVELNTNPEPYSIAVYSSDVEFWYKGNMRIPALNVGNGESIIDVNALAEAVLY